MVVSEERAHRIACNNYAVGMLEAKGYSGTEIEVWFAHKHADGLDMESIVQAARDTPFRPSRLD